MDTFKNKIALVTGAGSGIGRETAFALAREGCRLIICDVNEAGLESARIEIESLSKCIAAEIVDVSDRKAMEQFAAHVHSFCPALDILVNNAGIGVTGNFFDVPLDDWERVIGVNLMGVVYGCHLFVPKMVERGEPGQVVNVSSMAGYWTAPGMSTYSAAKFGVFGLTEALRHDLHGTGIGAMTVCPGFINTEIVKTTRFHGVPNETERRDHAVRAYERRNYGPEKAASVIVKGIRRNRKVLLVTPEAWLMYHMSRLSPGFSRFLAQSLTKRLMGE